MITCDLNPDYAKRAFESAIASLRRSLNKHPNEAMKNLIQKDIDLYQTGIDTIKKR